MGAPARSRRSADPHRERSIPLLLPPSRVSRHGVAETKCNLIGGTIREFYWSDVSTFSFLFLFYSFRQMEGEEGVAARCVKRDVALTTFLPSHVIFSRLRHGEESEENRRSYDALE